MRPTVIRNVRDFGVIVGEAVRKSGLSLREYAKPDSIPHNLIWQVINRKHTPKLDNVLRLCDLMGMELVLRRKR